MSALWTDMYGHCPLNKRRKKNAHVKKKEEILGNLVASQGARHFLLWQMCGFCLLKFEKQCDYDESSQFACDTERRMNGHVKSMHFQQLMETAAGMFLFYISFSVEV